MCDVPEPLKSRVWPKSGVMRPKPDNPGFRRWQARKNAEPKLEKDKMKSWKVRYIHLNDRATRHPFFKRCEIVEAETRKEAIEKIASLKTSGVYGEFSASPLR